MSAPTLVPGRFSWGDGTLYPGFYDPGERWNGFAVPFFTLPVARRIAAWNHAAYGRGEEVEDIVFDTRRNGFLMIGIDGEDFVPGVERRTTAGVQCLYPIGGWAWTWSEAHDFDGAPRRKGFRFLRARSRRNRRAGR